jgi:hypothetical protein
VAWLLWAALLLSAVWLLLAAAWLLSATLHLVAGRLLVKLGEA